MGLEHDLVDALPRFPRLKPQRDVAGRHYLTKPEGNGEQFHCSGKGGRRRKLWWLGLAGRGLSGGRLKTARRVGANLPGICCFA